MEAVEFNAKALDEFGERLETVRERKKLTRAMLAEKAGTHYDVILKLENGERRPSLATMCKIADALDIKVTGLLQARAR